MFTIEDAQASFPSRLERGPALQPCGMDSIARTINVTLPDALKAENEIAMLPRTGCRECLRKTPGRARFQGA